MRIHKYQELLVWQRAMDLVENVYVLTKAFPKDEVYGLSSQMRRAVVSIPSNIAEGSRRGTDKDFCHFPNMAFGSGAELETQFKIAKRLKYCDLKKYEIAEALLDETMKILNGFIVKLRSV